MMMPDKPLILASSSPRRQYLMKETGFDFVVRKPDVDESFPDDMPSAEIARHLAQKKGHAMRDHASNAIVITADTVVILDDRILNKPVDEDDARRMLTRLSGRTHTVMTGVCIVSDDREELFDETTLVTFADLTPEQIAFYFEHFKPLDKAGAYGAQDCLPPDANPCSAEEMDFLRSIGRLDLVEKAFTSGKRSGVVMIRKITGSYFNVMGLPVHKVHERLLNWP